MRDTTRHSEKAMASDSTGNLCVAWPGRTMRDRTRHSEKAIASDSTGMPSMFATLDYRIYEMRQSTDAQTMPARTMRDTTRHSEKAMASDSTGMPALGLSKVPTPAKRSAHAQYVRPAAGQPCVRRAAPGIKCCFPAHCEREEVLATSGIHGSTKPTALREVLQDGPNVVSQAVQHKDQPRTAAKSIDSR